MRWGLGNKSSKTGEIAKESLKARDSWNLIQPWILTLPRILSPHVSIRTRHARRHFLFNPCERGEQWRENGRSKTFKNLRKTAQMRNR